MIDMEAVGAIAVLFENLSFIPYSAASGHDPLSSAKVDRLDLLDHVYEGDADPDSNSLEVIVGRLRKKIGAALIETVRGRGYRVVER